MVRARVPPYQKAGSQGTPQKDASVVNIQSVVNFQEPRRISENTRSQARATAARPGPGQD